MLTFWVTAGSGLALVAANATIRLTGNHSRRALECRPGSPGAGQPACDIPCTRRLLDVGEIETRLCPPQASLGHPLATTGAKDPPSAPGPHATTSGNDAEEKLSVNTPPTRCCPRTRTAGATDVAGVRRCDAPSDAGGAGPAETPETAAPPELLVCVLFAAGKWEGDSLLATAKSSRLPAVKSLFSGSTSNPRYSTLAPRPDGKDKRRFSPEEELPPPAGHVTTGGLREREASWLGLAPLLFRTTLRKCCRGLRLLLLRGDRSRRLQASEPALRTACTPCSAGGIAAPVKGPGKGLREAPRIGFSSRGGLMLQLSLREETWRAEGNALKSLGSLPEEAEGSRGGLPDESGTTAATPTPSPPAFGESERGIRGLEDQEPLGLQGARGLTEGGGGNQGWLSPAGWVSPADWV